MSYGRNPHYIWSDGETMHLNGYTVPEYLINALLYKLLLRNRRKELAERLRAGREEWECMLKVIRDGSDALNSYTTPKIMEMPKDDPEYQMFLKWREMNEDELVKRLMSEEDSDA